MSRKPGENTSEFCARHDERVNHVSTRRSRGRLSIMGVAAEPPGRPARSASTSSAGADGHRHGRVMMIVWLRLLALSPGRIDFARTVAPSSAVAASSDVQARSSSLPDDRLELSSPDD